MCDAQDPLLHAFAADLQYGCVNTGGGDALSLHNICTEVLIEPVVRGDAPSVSRGRSDGVLGLRQHVAPAEFALSEGFVELVNQVLSSCRGKGGDEARESLVRTRVARPGRNAHP